MISSVQRLAPGIKLVFWDLGLSNVQHVNQVRKVSNPLIFTLL